MQQRFRRVALFVGAVTLVSGGLVMVACGSDTATTNPTPGVDAARVDTGVGSSGDTGVDEDTGTGDGGTDVDCGNDPKLRTTTTGVRCAFYDAGAGSDAGSICPTGDTCCNTSDKIPGTTTFEPTFCAPGTKGGDYAAGAANCKAAAADAGSTFNTGNAWECQDKNQCGTGQICCMIQDPARLAMDPVKNKLNIGLTPKTDTKHPQACGVQRTYNEGGGRCRTPANAAAPNCPDATEIKLCSMSDDNCGAGTVCTPFIDFQNFVDRGYCK